MHVPDEWRKLSLSRVAEIRTGVAKGKKNLKDPVELPYLRVANVQDGYIDLSEVKHIQIERSQIERFSLKNGDVLMTEGGDFDKLGRGDVWNGKINPCLHQNHVFAVRPNQLKLDSYFLAALSASHYGKTYFLSCSKQSTNLASINSTQLKDFPVLLPPLPEQQKIAQILSTWDKAIEKLEALIAAKQKRKKALMQQLLTGKKRFAGFDRPWRLCYLGDVCLFKGGSAFNENYQGKINGEIPFIKVSDMNIPNNSVFINDANNWVSVEVSKKLKAKPFPKGAIVFAKVGAALLLNRRRILTRDTIIDNNMMAAIPNENSSTSFLYQLMLIIDFAKLVQDGAVPSINQSDLARLKIKIPEIKEQQKKGLMQQLLTGKKRVTL